MNPINESILIERCRAGESVAFGPLIKLYRKQLYSYLYRFGGDKNLAEDLFQETLIKVWRSLPKYNEQNKFSSWLFSIAHNTAMDALRKKQKNKLLNDLEDTELIPGRSNPHDELIYKETAESISKVVDLLPVKQKEVFLLRINGELTFKEIAEITGEPLNTVLSHMHYSVKKIKKIVGSDYAK
ncbi:MAG: sigma-70 family RNA polymerase sigma factor [Bacteroidota bacterium]